MSYIESIAVRIGNIKNSLKFRIAVFWAALLYLFGLKSNLVLFKGIQMSVASDFVQLSTWVSEDAKNWNHWVVTFDGKKAVGYVDGVEVTK